MEKLYTAIIRFFYKKIKNNQKFTGIGVPGLRDKENRCDWYKPTKHTDYHMGGCNGDGHFLCKDCTYHIND